MKTNTKRLVKGNEQRQGNYSNKGKQIEMSDCPRKSIKKWNNVTKFEEYFLKLTNKDTHCMCHHKSYYLSSIKFKQIGSIFRINNKNKNCCYVFCVCVFLLLASQKKDTYLWYSVEQWIKRKCWSHEMHENETETEQNKIKKKYSSELCEIYIGILYILHSIVGRTAVVVTLSVLRMVFSLSIFLFSILLQ